MSWYSLVLPSAFLLALPGIAGIPPGRAVTLPAGTPINVRLDRALSTASDPAGAKFSATLTDPIRVNGNVVIPRGTQCFGTVVASKRSGRLKGRPQMALRLDAIQAFGRTYPVMTAGSDFAGRRARRRNFRWIGGSAAGGSLIGAIAGGGAGALIGAGVGAVGGTAAAAATGRRNLTLPAETPLTFTLAKPVTLQKAPRTAR